MRATRSTDATGVVHRRDFLRLCTIAAATLGRVCRTVEIEPVFCDVIRRRWTAYARAEGIDEGAGALEPDAEPATPDPVT